MIMRSSKSIWERLYLQLVIIMLLALLIHEPSSRLANAQLEAVGAVLSVVPVTSILATAGLVGVKLAALSRLLDILGYDRAYLAQNLGTGTAAAPIGLQTRYAYMFPYVPGLNISVRGDDSIGMPKETVTESTENGSKSSSGVAAGFPDIAGGEKGGPPRRKTYPAMSLPANYENQQKPFRGSEALKDIFNKAGLQVHIPTAAQQQQLQQKFNLPPQVGNHAIVIELPPESTSKSPADKQPRQQQPKQQRKQQQQPIATRKGSSSRHSNTVTSSSLSVPDLSLAKRNDDLPSQAYSEKRATSIRQAELTNAAVANKNGGPVFGMPVSNINTLKRRRRRRRRYANLMDLLN